VVASRGGDDRPPAWLGNLIARPDVQVAVGGGPRQPMQARVATPAERAELWPKVVADHTLYDGYQNKTTREIALVLLEPTP
jgi:deazaflavin-dependent oxidoreductase (nitroreductase family)